MSGSKQHHSVSVEELIALMKEHGLRVTAPRQAILTALAANHGPFTAEDLHKLITRRVCDLATIYRSLISLEEVGLLRRIEFGDGFARYELATPGHDHHHHVVCTKCKKVEIIDEEEIEEIDRFARKRGFTEVSHILEFFGICPDCR